MDAQYPHRRLKLLHKLAHPLYGLGQKAPLRTRKVMYRYHVDILHEHKVRCTQGAPVSASAEDATDLNLQRVGVVVSGQTMQECQDGVTLVTHDICACKAPGGQVAFQGTRTKSPPGLGLASARVGTCTGGAWCPFGRSRHKACGWGRCFGEGANAYNPPTGPVT